VGFAQPAPEATAQPTYSVAELPQEPAIQSLAEPSTHPGAVGFVPLRAGERTDLFFKGFLGSPTTYYESVAAASVGLIANQPEGWHRTFGGYSKRVVTGFTLYTVEEVTHDAGDAALDLDPRYFRCRCNGGFRRAANAVKMTFLAYDRNGDTRLDLPRLVGDYGASMLVTTWYPANYSPLTRGVQTGHVQLGLDIGVNLIREFSPELKRFFHRSRQL
jgi:hypothetical protein